MVRLGIKVTDSDKWVTVEDMRGPQIKFDDLIKKDATVKVNIHSTDTTPGDVVVYAGRVRNDRTAKFHNETFAAPCTLVLSDSVVYREGGDDAALDECDKCDWLDPCCATDPDNAPRKV